MRMLVKAARILMVALVVGAVATSVWAAVGNGGKYQNIVVVSYLANSTATATYNVQGDGKNANAAGLSAYVDGLDSVSSILNANTYNMMPVGDWQLSMLSSTARTVR